MIIKPARWLSSLLKLHFSLLYFYKHIPSMSRPSLTSAVRRISRPRPRATVSGLTPSAPTLSSSASLCHSSYRTSASPATLNQSSRARSNLYRVPRTCLITTQKCSPFSSSATRPAAQVTQNPRVDEEGKTLMMDISARAAKVRFTCLSNPCARLFRVVEVELLG
ncbi:hypothetical protein BJX70DRAFT_5997 [Aspergillus crustosus]